ncbi:GD21770 [Drosophila simulans]|uniref:GD21770 n=1 Tax=Drosophila simulans TaxID=7240 RepID=B4Q9I1_DROSI|nr:GD21770 [Drosophila simulans]
MCSAGSDAPPRREPGNRCGSWEQGAGIWDPGSLALTQCNLLAARLSCRRLGLNLVPPPSPPAAASPPCALCAPPQAQRLGVTSSLAYMQCSIVLVSPGSPQLLAFQLPASPVLRVILFLGFHSGDVKSRQIQSPGAHRIVVWQASVPA